MSASVRTQRRGFWPARVGLAALIALTSVNIWTGGPLLALWLGAQVQGGGGLGMGTVFAVIVALAVILSSLAILLTRLGRAYDTLTAGSSLPQGG